MSLKPSPRGTDSFENSALIWAFRTANPVTGNPVSLLTAGALLREARRQGLHAEALGWLMKHRREQLTSLTNTQRKWQGKTRRQSRAHHHDSVSIRERYVRIANH